jgi:hypothetical protein
MEVSGQLDASAGLLSRKDCGTHWRGGWVGLVGLEAVAKKFQSLSCWELNTVFQLVTKSLY